MFYETKELPATETRTGKWHELAEAIRRGCIGTKQHFGWLYSNDKTATCALGAANRGGWHEGAIVNKNCPDCHIHQQYPIIHLNDDHRWTREAIADWLDTL